MRWLIPCVLAGCAGSPAHETLHPSLAGKKSPVDVYWPKDADSAAPLVIVAHGFARSRHRMSGWGTHLSEAGFVVAVPNLPSFAKHHDNADGILDLVDVMTRGYPTRVDAERVARERMQAAQ